MLWWQKMILKSGNCCKTRFCYIVMKVMHKYHQVSAEVLYNWIQTHHYMFWRCAFDASQIRNLLTLTEVYNFILVKDEKGKWCCSNCSLENENCLNKNVQYWCTQASLCLSSQLSPADPSHNEWSGLSASILVNTWFLHFSCFGNN